MYKIVLSKKGKKIKDNLIEKCLAGELEGIHRDFQIDAMHEILTYNTYYVRQLAKAILRMITNRGGRGHIEEVVEIRDPIDFPEYPWY